MAVNFWVCVRRSEVVAGVTLTEMAACGEGSGAGGGSPLWTWELLTPLPGTDAHPPRKATVKRHTKIPMGERATARTPESEIKVEVLRCLPEGALLPTGLIVGAGSKRAI